MHIEQFGRWVVVCMLSSGCSIRFYYWTAPRFGM